MGVQSFPAATSGVKSIQRGVTNVGYSASGGLYSSIINVTISAVNMAKAYVNLSIGWSSTNGTTAQSRYFKARLTSATNLEFAFDFGTLGVDVPVAWEIIESY